MPNRDEQWRTRVATPTIERMPVHVDPALPIHPLTVDDLYAMVDAGILAEDERVELLDGVLVEVSPPGPEHIGARNELVAAAGSLLAQGYRLSVQNPLDTHRDTCWPEPDLAIIAAGAWPGRAPSGALLVAEISHSSLRIDLGRKAVIYAAGQIPEYWVLDLDARRLIVHREPAPDGYREVRAAGDAESVTALELPLTVAVADLLPRR